eukprot:SAG31_NODE_1052_length_10154_cov_2.814818_6_plen_221_part_00
MLGEQQRDQSHNPLESDSARVALGSKALPLALQRQAGIRHPVTPARTLGLEYRHAPRLGAPGKSRQLAMDDDWERRLQSEEGELGDWQRRVEARLKALERSPQILGQPFGAPPGDPPGGMSENPLASAQDGGATAPGTAQPVMWSTSGFVEAIILRTVASMQGAPTNVHQVSSPTSRKVPNKPNKGGVSDRHVPDRRNAHRKWIRRSIPVFTRAHIFPHI